MGDSSFLLLLQTLWRGGEQSTIETFEIAFFFFCVSLFKIPSVVNQSFFPFWFLLLAFHVQMCLDRQLKIPGQIDERILMDSR